MVVVKTRDQRERKKKKLSLCLSVSLDHSSRRYRNATMTRKKNGNPRSLKSPPAPPLSPSIFQSPSSKLHACQVMMLHQYIIKYSQPHLCRYLSSSSRPSRGMARTYYVPMCYRSPPSPSTPLPRSAPPGDICIPDRVVWSAAPLRNRGPDLTYILMYLCIPNN